MSDLRYFFVAKEKEVEKKTDGQGRSKKRGRAVGWVHVTILQLGRDL
jgi:hypothetical protein